MLENIWKKIDKYKNVGLFSLLALLLLFFSFIFKNDEKILKKSVSLYDLNQTTDLKSIKDFLLSRIKSPFINLNYTIEKGDTIQKILKKYKVQNNEIQSVIKQYKKYAKPNQLFVGNIINIIIGYK